MNINIDMKREKRKEFDKFYTEDSVAYDFVSNVDKLLHFSTYDLIIEPAAGAGAIYKYLPKDKRLGFDIVPELLGIEKKSFYDFGEDLPMYINERLSDYKILTITNPPFGKGYMNPDAKKFFNHAAKFSKSIAFIVPSKWHSSWKVQKQLDNRYGLYHSKILPKNSFVLDGKPYDVNCCQQVWSLDPVKNCDNLRILERPATSHPDFDVFLTCDKVLATKDAFEKLKNKEYWEFGIKYWGKIGIHELENIPVNTTTHFLIKTNKTYVRNIFENIKWADFIFNMGAPNIGGKSVLVNAYMITKDKMGIN